MEDLTKEPPTNIDPYKVLQIEITASLNEVKSAYKKLALKHHPDKVQPDARDSAHVKFQEVAFAYAILSDERRRKRYDITGNTSESLHLEDDGFDWGDFFRAQWAEAVTGQKLNNFRDAYQNSEEERLDVLSAYRSSEGNLNQVFREVMLSNPLDDEDRFHEYIDKAIESGEVQSYDAYVNESLTRKENRRHHAVKEGEEAKEYAKKLGVHDELFGSKKSKLKKNGEVDDEAGLADLIKSKQKHRAATFLDDLEAKHVGGGKKGGAKGKSGSKRKVGEPPEELFQTNRKKMRRDAKPVDEVEDHEDIVNLETTSECEEEEAEDDDHDFEEIDEEEVKPTKPKKNGAKGREREPRGRRGATKMSYVASESEEEEEEDVNPTKSKKNGAKARQPAPRRRRGALKKT